MVQKDKSIDADKFANSWLIFSSSLFVIFLVLYYTIKNVFWGGLIAFFISTFVCFLVLKIEIKKRKKKFKISWIFSAILWQKVVR
jgi:Flp pilus assembly protein TadB